MTARSPLSPIFLAAPLAGFALLFLLAPKLWPNSEGTGADYAAAVEIGDAKGALSLPAVVGSRDPLAPLIVIDAGHGGHDPGARDPDTGRQEKDVTLGIARAIRDALVATGRVRVALTRDDDVFLVLEERYELARKLGANLFISIHADAAENREASGGSVYTLSEAASTKEAELLAARENKADILNGVDLSKQDAQISDILIDLTQRESMAVATQFSKALIRSAGQRLRLRSDAHQFAGFVVLKSPDTPSVLFETGYITNPNDSALLSSATGRHEIAAVVRDAVLVHFAKQRSQ